MFVRLAVFPADFSLDAAEMVVSDAVVQERDVLDLLTRLVEKSLVTTLMTGETYRYRLLETLREYALARLDERGEVDRWNDRLLQWAMTRVDHVEASLRRPAQDAALQSAQRRRRHVAGRDELGRHQRRPARRIADRRGRTHRPRRRATPDHHLTARATRIRSRTVVRGPRLLRARGHRVGAGRLGGVIRIPRRGCRAVPARQGPHGTPRGPPISASSRLGAPAIWPRRTLSSGRQSTVSAAMVTTMGLGYALSDAALLSDGSRRGRATGRRSRRLPASDRHADRHRPQRRRTRNHRLRPG